MSKNFIILLALIAPAACVRSGDDAESSSGLASLKMTMPQKSKVAKEERLQKLLASVRVKVEKTTGSTCSPDIQKKVNWANEEALSIPDISVKKGCDYRATVEVGKENGSELIAYYKGDSIVTQEQINKADPKLGVKVEVTVKVTEAGKKEGFSTENISTGGLVNVNIDISFEGGASPAPSPASGTTAERMEKMQGVTPIETGRVTKNTASSGARVYSLVFEDNSMIEIAIGGCCAGGACYNSKVTDFVGDNASSTKVKVTIKKMTEACKTNDAVPLTTGTKFFASEVKGVL